MANAGIFGAPAAVTYSAAPAVSHVTYAAPAPAHITYAAGAPLYKAATYAAAPVAIHAPAVGSSHESTLRSLDGNSAVSHYSKAVDTAFSSVRKFDTRITNDAKIVAAAPAYAYAAAPATYSYAPAAPVVAKTVYAAPTYAYSAPVVTKTAYAAPSYAYSAPVVAKTAYAAAAPAYLHAAPAAYAPAAGIVAHTSFSGLGASYAW